MIIDDEWRTAMIQHSISLDEFRHQVSIDASRDRITLSGRLNEINKIVKYIEKSVCRALLKQNSCHNEHRDIYESSRNSPENELIGEEKKLNGMQQKNEKQRPEKVDNGFTDHSDDSLVDDDNKSVNSKGTRLENGAKQRNKGRELSELKRNGREERDEQSETYGTFRHEGKRVDSASAAITKVEWEHRGRDEDIDLVVCPFTLKDHQLKFIKCFYPDVYKHLNSLQLLKTSSDKVQMYGKPDDVNKLSNWLIGHSIALVEHQQIQTHLSADEVKTVMGDAKWSKCMLMMDVLRDGTYTAIGSLQDIRLLQSEIRDRETAITRSSSALLRMSATSNDSDLRFEFTTPRSSINVIIAKGDLTKQDTKAIVSPSNSQLKPYGGAAKAIAIAAGYQLMDECSRYIRIHGSLSTTKVMYTSAGRMFPPISYVIHACGPIDKGNWKLEEELEKTFMNCFKCAEELRVKSLSIPAISSGAYKCQRRPLILALINRCCCLYVNGSILSSE